MEIRRQRVLSFHHVSPRDGMQVLRLYSKSLYPWSHLAGPHNHIVSADLRLQDGVHHTAVCGVLNYLDMCSLWCAKSKGLVLQRVSQNKSWSLSNAGLCFLRPSHETPSQGSINPRQPSSSPKRLSESLWGCHHQQ